MNTSATDFTVQEVVERSGQSLRTFYQYFAGKYGCCSPCSTSRSRARLRTSRRSPPSTTIRSTACTRSASGTTACVARVDRGSRRPARRRCWSNSVSSCSRRTPTKQRARSRRVVELLGRLLDEADAAGALRPGLDRRRISGVVLQATMFNSFATVISASPPGAGDEVLWDLLVNGITRPRLTGTGGTDGNDDDPHGPQLLPRLHVGVRHPRRRRGDEVVQVRGDQDHPLTHGLHVRQGPALAEMHHHPDRSSGRRCASRCAAATVLGRLPRRPGRQVCADHRRARPRRGRHLLRQRPRHGRLGLSHGAAAAGGDRHAGEVQPADHRRHRQDPGLRPRRRFPGFSVRPDYERAKLVIFIGINPIVSHGHTSRCPTPSRRCTTAAPRTRGLGDRSAPERDRRLATHHLAPRPGTDYAVLAYLVRDLLRDGADPSGARADPGARRLGGCGRAVRLGRTRRGSATSTPTISITSSPRCAGPGAWPSTPVPASRWRRARTSRSGWRGS